MGKQKLTEQEKEYFAQATKVLENVRGYFLNSQLEKEFSGLEKKINELEAQEILLPHLTEKNIQKAFFLDRDGILIEDVGYPHKKEQIKIIHEIVPLILEAQKKGYKIIVLTNQSGIARGYFTEEDYFNFTNELERKLLALDVKINDWFHCPDLDEKSALRKPNPGLMIQAIEKHFISPQDSLMIGDKESDRLSLFGPKYFVCKTREDLKKINFNF